ncbi:MAG: sensor domain-containing diguanylate cyclase [Gammaproteobacteria bacterium]|nr:sensor domain-containing diguanylate cyclase [Gammaproteobacteria bacterium]
MKQPDTPQDEQARLETLRSLNILDTPPEERFDRLTRMAKRLFGVPIALVSLVDENRQWFKSCFGLSASETSRDISFCGHAILGNDPFIIRDTIVDERFADNPLVLNDPHIRFYAGCPLSAPNGRKLGTLCIIDRQPRSFGKEDLEALKDLASMVERELAAVQLATLDELTAISNRRGFLMLAQHSLHLCVRQKMSAYLVFMDLDKFKPINDTFGHAEGDRALTVFAEHMKVACRESDIFARLGGDEFAVLLINTSMEHTEDVISRLRQSLAKYNLEAKRGYDISFSHGIVGFNPEKHHTIDALLAEGDSLMYELKRSKD